MSAFSAQPSAALGFAAPIPTPPKGVKTTLLVVTKDEHIGSNPLRRLLECEGAMPEGRFDVHVGRVATPGCQIGRFDCKGCSLPGVKLVTWSIPAVIKSEGQTGAMAPRHKLY
jgi:hypothetical protein